MNGDVVCLLLDVLATSKVTSEWRFANVRLGVGLWVMLGLWARLWGGVLGCGICVFVYVGGRGGRTCWDMAVCIWRDE